MNDFLFWLFMTPAGLTVLAILIVPGTIVGLFLLDKAVKRQRSTDKMVHRDLVAKTIERGDYLAMEEKDFREWLSANSNDVFPHEREAMERARKAKGEKKPAPSRN